MSNVLETFDFLKSKFFVLSGWMWSRISSFLFWRGAVEYFGWGWCGKHVCSLSRQASGRWWRFNGGHLLQHWKEKLNHNSYYTKHVSSLIFFSAYSHGNLQQNTCEAWHFYLFVPWPFQCYLGKIQCYGISIIQLTIKPQLLPSLIF